MEILLILLIFISILFTSEEVEVSESDLPGRRDGSMKSLAKLLNNNKELFSTWRGSEEDYVRFIKVLDAWLLSPPPDPRATTLQLPPLPPLNCAQPRYSQALTGRVNPPGMKRVIIDFIPFGYDIDKLEIRFHELNEVVDLFFIYEFPRTLTGMKRTCYYHEKLRNDVRFKPFQHKIVHTVASDEDVQQLTKSVRSDLNLLENRRRLSSQRHSRQHTSSQVNQNGLHKSNKIMHRTRGTHDLHFDVPKSKKWALVIQMRFEMITRFYKLMQEVVVSNSTLVHEVSSRPAALNHLSSSLLTRIKAGIVDGTALGIQNDADEIPTGVVIQHLQQCEIKPQVEFVYLPCTSFKKNFYWLQKTTDLSCLKGPDITPDTEDVKHYLWRPAPWVWPLRTMLKEGNTMRHYLPKDRRECHIHMGLGAASHLSSGAEPVEYWQKRAGVIEESFQGAISSAFVEAGKVGGITPELIFNETMQPWCRHSNPSKHINILSKEARRAIWDSVPRLVLEYPERYPFFVPTLALASKRSVGDNDIVGITARTVDASWGNSCRES